MSSATAADLPPHGPLRVLIVSDEVNPHGLSNADLTQPGDLSTALNAPGSGLSLDIVTEIPTDSLATATAALSVPVDDPLAYDVLIYFAHRIPTGGSGAADQAAFVAAVENFLEDGGGVVSFHHGAYLTAGKEAMQDLIGGTAVGLVPYDTIDGQNVINVAPLHFITSNGVDYTGTTSYSDPGRGVPAGDYDFFNNVPDERYLQFDINPSAGTIEVLFASDYNQNGTTHLLGFTHQRPAWAGIVVAYQPGEYQPNALDDIDGNNFQILANAIVYAAAQGACDCDDGDPCTADTCDPVDGCHNDGAPALDCKSAQNALLILKQNGGSGDKQLFKWNKGATLSLAELDDPTDTTEYAVCMYTGGADDLLESFSVPPAAGNWSPIGTKGYKYKEPNGANQGLNKILLKGSDTTGKSKVLVKGSGSNLPDPGLASMSLPVTVQVINSDSGACVEAVFNAAIKHTSTLFKAKTP